MAGYGVKEFTKCANALGWTYDENEKTTIINGENVKTFIYSITNERPAQPQKRLRIDKSSILECQSAKERCFVLGVADDMDFFVSLECVMQGMAESIDLISIINEATSYFQTTPNSFFKRYGAGECGTVGKLFSVSCIKYKNGGVLFTDEIEKYFNHFDNRPYRTVSYSEVDYIYVNSEINDKPKDDSDYPVNWLVSGAPGTGKSYDLNMASIQLVCSETKQSVIEEYVKNDKSNDEESVKRKKAEILFERTIGKYIQRVTFYEDYSYENFVGCYKPVPIDNDATKISFDGKTGAFFGSKIVYMYEPGPFVDMIVKASNDPTHNYCLIIEEINRAKAASVFGDMFQLLDRKDGVSVYGITPDSALNKYLFAAMKNYEGILRLPSNLYIWATMNSADQGVFPIDSAFKRRWSYLCKDVYSPRQGEDVISEITFYFEGKLRKALWDQFRNLINEKIGNVAEEDKFVGPWYFSNEELLEINNCNKLLVEGKKCEKANPLVEKLFLYLRNDVFRNDPEEMFVGGRTISSILHVYKNNDGNIASLETILNIDVDEIRKILLTDEESTAE